MVGAAQDKSLFDATQGFVMTRPALRAISMGLLAAFVGYSASFAIVLAGLTAMGASEAQAATGLFFASLGMALGSIWLPLATRTPSAVAWSTPGAAFFAASGALPGGFAEAVGAMICCALLLLLTGFVPILGRFVAAIPKPIGNALLAGVLLKLCFAPALALADMPQFIAPVILAWVIGLRINKMTAMPTAIFAFLIVLIFAVDPDQAAATGGDFFPQMAFVAPEFTLQSLISVSIPLYLVTMAGQNIPGFAVLELKGYPVERQPLLRKTGWISLGISVFGAIPVNMSAITAAMMAGEDAGKDPEQRYWAAVTSGVAYMVLALLAGVVTTLFALAPLGLITGLAGLALLPALVGSLSAAFDDTSQLEAPALTFLISASGMSLFGISGAFWGIVIGVLIWTLKGTRPAPK